MYKKEFADDDYPYIWWIQYTADGKYIVGEYGFEYEQGWLEIFCIVPFLLLFLVPIYLMVFARGRIKLLTLDFNTNFVKVEPMTWTIFGTKTATMSTPFIISITFGKNDDPSSKCHCSLTRLIQTAAPVRRRRPRTSNRLHSVGMPAGGELLPAP